MRKLAQKDAKNVEKQDQVNDFEPTEIDFGLRTVTSQNFSKLVALPKQALANCGDGETTKVSVKLVKDKNETYLKLVPVCKPDKERGGDSNE